MLWEDGFATDPGNLGGTTNTNAFDINNQGQVVGVSALPDETTIHAFLWEKGVMRDLGALPGDVASEADGINSKDQVVGRSFDIDGNGRAFIWQNGLMTDLNTLIPADFDSFLIGATGYINSRGQIAGLAFQTSTGEAHAFLLTPNAEGATSSAPTVPDGQSRRGPKVVLPANIREMLGKLAKDCNLKSERADCKSCQISPSTSSTSSQALTY